MLTRLHLARPMIRDARGDDVATVVELWREFEAEVPEPAWRDDEADVRRRELERAIGTDIVLLAEQDARPGGRRFESVRGLREAAHRIEATDLGEVRRLVIRPALRGHGPPRCSTT
jgi:hypothetical protein